MNNFLADHPNNNEPKEECEIGFISSSTWKLWFDGAKIESAFGIGFVIESPDKVKNQEWF